MRELGDGIVAASRKHCGQRQSSPAAGIGRRGLSSAHQQGPAGLQTNSAPQPEHVRQREVGFSVRFVMNNLSGMTAETSGVFHVRFIANGSIVALRCRSLSHGNPKRNRQGETDKGKPARDNRWPAIR
jgi:hypothetical protein